MSSTFSFPSNKPLPVAVRVTGNTATTIVDGTNEAFFVPWFEVNENNGSTPALTVDLYDGTNPHYLGHDEGTVVWNARTVVAWSSYKFTAGYIVPIGWKLRVTSNDASGRFHVLGIKSRLLS